MATQGIVTVTKDEAVVLKVIAGSDGKNAKKLAATLREMRPPFVAKQVYAIAKQCKFGSEHDLVVLTEKVEYSKCIEPISPLYRSTFSQPQFNPRWECGIADYVEVISV
jgi:hypothetical protein